MCSISGFSVVRHAQMMAVFSSMVDHFATLGLSPVGSVDFAAAIRNGRRRTETTQTLLPGQFGLAFTFHRS